ncbi:MAG: ABC transporter permease [Acidobacteriota bacterium]
MQSIEPSRLKAHLWLIRLIGIIVPRRLRLDWRQEWEAELRYREHLLAEWDNLHWRNRVDLLRRSFGALVDALFLQPQRMEDEMFQDVRFGVRMLMKTPGFTLAAFLSLTIGIGATSAIFSIVNGVLLKPLPYLEPDRLVRLWHSKPQAGMTDMPVSGGNVQIWRERAQSFESVAAFSPATSVITDESETEQLQGARVSYNLMPLLGFQPLLGRGFVADENKSGNDKVVLLSHQLWQRRFGADESIIGRSITLNHTNQYTVVGVMPPEVSFPGQSEYWIPETSTVSGRHDMRGSGVIARLKSGVTVEMATNEIALIHQQLQEQIPGDYQDWGVNLQPLHDSIVGKVRPTLLILFGAVGFVLLIACANVANLLLARAVKRQKEMAMRAALGARRGRLIRQLLTESTLLALFGGAGGALLAQAMVKGLIALNPPDVPRLTQVSVDGRVFAFMFFTTLVVGLIFGLAPAFHSSKPDLNHALKQGATSTIGRRRWLRRFGLRDLLVVSQTTLAVILMVGAGLLMKSFIRLQQVELGFTPTRVITMSLLPPLNRFPKDYKTANYYRQMLDSINALPGVESAAAMTSAPTTGAFMSAPILINGQPAPLNADSQRAFVSVVSPDYFQTIGNPLKAGRWFTDADNESAPPVAIINETLARRYFAGANPIGQRIALKGEPEKWLEIIGVTTDVKQFGLARENQPGFYQSYQQKDVSFMTLAVRTTAEPETLIAALRTRILEVDKFTAITRVRTLEQLLADSVAQPRFYLLLLGLFADIALALAALGIYGLMAYTVNQRTHEIGIRLALGAGAQRILRLIVGQGFALILFGLAIGMFGAYALTRLLTDLLFAVSATDPTVFILIAFTLMTVALIACLIPARKAARTDPMVALRHE